MDIEFFDVDDRHLDVVSRVCWRECFAPSSPSVTSVALTLWTTAHYNCPRSNNNG